MADSADERHSFYSLLNVPKDAGDDQIKRAYRSLAQSLHPDKHTDEELRTRAQEAFQRLQEAYEVLRDPQKRAVYDVYGLEGLAAGLQVGTKLDGPEELRRKWEEFKAQQAAAADDAAVSHRAYYMCMLDAVKLVKGDLSSAPLPRVVVVNNSVSIPVTPADTLSLQGSAALRAKAGQGSVIAGYERALTPRDSLSASFVLGLQSLATLTSSRQLGQYTSASLTATYNPTQGLGLQLASSRKVTARTSAQFAWVVGPAAASGMALSLTTRGAQYAVVAKLEVGAVTSASLRLSWALHKKTELRLAARAAASSGLEGELGVLQRMAGSSTTYCACTVNRMGVLAKLRYTRVNQVYEFPVLVANDYTDWKVLAATALGPPAAALLVMRCVVRPWSRWRARVHQQRQQQEQATQLAQQYSKAAAESALLAGVAARTAAAEAARGGLVVLVAVYGALQGWREALQQQAAAVPSSSCQQQQQQQQQQQGTKGPGPDEARPALNGNHVADGAAQSAPAAAPPPPPPAAAAAAAAAGSGAHDASSSGSAAAAGAAAATSSSSSSSSSGASSTPAVQHPWVDVTCALQYLVRDGALQLHPGVSKIGLMGFADVALQQPRQLYAAFALGQQLFEVTIDDLDMLRVPGAGQPVLDPKLQRWLLQRLQLWQKA